MSIPAALRLRRQTPRPSAALRSALCVGFGACLLGMIALSAPAVAAAPGTERLARIGFSRSMFRNVNENDARASIRTYAAAMSRDLGVPTDPNPVLFDGVSGLRVLLRQQAVDTVSLTIEEYFSVEIGLLRGPLMMANVGGSFTEEYLLAVRQDSGFTRLADLRGHHVLVLDSLRANLAPHWIETLLAANGLPPADAFFGQFTLVAKPAKVALPVFFRQEEACVVTRHSLDVLGELNPQVAAQLRILAVSPEVVPAITCFRGDIEPGEADRIAAAVCISHQLPAGKQVMNIFQSDRVELQPSSRLDSTRALWAAYLRLPRPRAPAPPLPAPAASGQGGDR
jgi:hypothetical protein